MAAPYSAAAASLQEITDFGNNPSGAKMFVYVPDKPAASPPLLVAVHWCGGNANAYFTGTGYRGLADQHGFIVIYPQTTSSDGCFDVHSDATLHHDAGGDSGAIASMVRYSISKYSANPERVYVAGTSSGAMMTNVLLGAYPDIFKGGAAFAGVPYGCFAGASGWNSACASGQTTKNAQQWGDLVRAAYPAYTGPRPRVQLWHGDQDETLSFHNFGEEIKQWTNVLGVSEAPTTTDKNAPQSGWTRTRYADAAGIVRVEAVVETGMTHNLTVPAAEVVRFFGLDAASDPAGAAAGSGGTGGTGGSGAGGSSGANVAPGAAGGAAGTSISSAGVPGAAGSSAMAGNPAVGAPRSGVGGNAGTQSGGAGVIGAAGFVSTADQAGAPHELAGSAGPSPAAAQDMSSSCSVHIERTHSPWPVALILLVVRAGLRRRRRTGQRRPEPRA